MNTSRRYRPTGLREALAAQDRTVVWSARKAGVSHPLIFLALTGRRTLSEVVAGRIADALGLPMDAIFTEVVRDTTRDDRAA